MEPLGQTTSHSSPQPIEETSVKGSKQQTSHRTINEKISALWKSITDRLEIPKPLRKFFATLYDYGSEVQKRIGYILRQILPNLFFSNTVFKAVEKPIVSGPSKGGQENLRILLTRQLTNGKEEEILNFEDLLITHQVNEDIPRTFWPLSYCKDRNTTPSVCADSQKRDASIDPNKRNFNCKLASNNCAPRLNH